MEQDGPVTTVVIDRPEARNAVDRATADAPRLRAVRDPGTLTVEITASGMKPSAGHVVWLERSYDPDLLYSEYLPSEFVLYQEQRVASPAVLTPFSFDDFFEIPAGVSQLSVIDSAGSHALRIT